MADLKLQVILNAVDKMTAPVRSALASTQALSHEVNKSRQEITKLNQVQKKIDGYRQAQQQIAATNLQYEQSSKKLIKLEQYIKNTAEPTKTLINEQARLERSHVKLAQKLENQKRALETSQIELKESGVDVNNLDKSEKHLQTQIDKSTKSFNKHAPEIEQVKFRLSKLNALQKKLNGFSKLKNDLESTSVALKQQQREVKRLQEEYEKTDKPTKRLTKSLQLAKEKLQKLGLTEKQQTTNLRQMQTALDRAGYSTRDLGHSQRKISKNIHDTTRALGKQYQQLNKLAEGQRRLNKLKAVKDRSFQRAGNLTVAGAGAVATGRTVLQKIVQPVSVAMDFEEQISKVQALTRLDKSIPEQAKKIAQLRQQALDLGASTSFSASEAAGAQSFLAMSGFTPDKIMKSLPGMLSLAKAAGAELARTADISSNILSGFRLEADQMGRVGDVLTATFTRSNVDLEMLGEAMKYAAPVSAELNISLEETAAMAGLLGNVGIQASMAGTSMRALFNRMAAPPKMAEKALDKIGVKTADSTGKMRAVPEILAEIAQKTEKMGNAQRMGIFKAIAGAEAGAAMATLVAKEGAEGITKFTNILKGSAGEADRVAKTMSDNTKGLAKEATSAIESLNIALGDELKPTVDSLLKSITEMTRSATKWVKENPELAKTIMKVVTAIAALTVIMGGLTMIMASILGPMALVRFGLGMLGIKAGGIIGVIWRLITTLGAFAGRLTLLGGLLARATIGAVFAKLASGAMMAMRAFRLLGIVLMANPVILIATAIAGAAYLIYKNWDTIKKWFGTLWDAITPYFKATWDTFKTLFSWTPLGIIISNWGSIKPYFSQLWENIKSIFSWDTVKTLFSWTPLGMIISNWDSLKTYFSALGSEIIGNISNAWQQFKTILAWSPLPLIQSVFEQLFTWFKQLPAKFLEFGKNMMQSLAEGIAEKLAFITNMIKSVGDAITGIKTKISDKVSGIKKSISEKVSNTTAAIKNSKITRKATDLAQGAGRVAGNMASRFKSGFKNLLGINSPSRVFIQYGKDINNGLAIGLQNSTVKPESKTAETAKTLKKFLATTAIAGGMSITPAIAQVNNAVRSSAITHIPATTQVANTFFDAPQRSYIVETKQEKNNYQQSQQQVSQLLASKQQMINQAPAAPINIKIEVHATPGMDEQMLVDLMDRKLRDGLRQSDYRRRHQLFDGYKL